MSNSAMLETLAKEADALRMRALANEERMASLKRKASENFKNVPTPAPRQSKLSITDEDRTLEPTAPADSRTSFNDHANLTKEELIERLVQIENMNRDWVAYNDQREIFVQELTAKYHSTTNELSNAVASIETLKNNQKQLAEETQRKADVHLANARNEIKRKEELNEDLLARLKEAQEQLKLEQKLLYNANQKNEKLEVEISNLETVNQNLNRFLEHDRSSKWNQTAPEPTAIEEKMDKMSRKLDKITIQSGQNTARSTSSNATDTSKVTTRRSKAKRAPPIPPLPNRAKINDRRSLGVEVYRPDTILKPLDPKSTKSRRSVDTTAISCENCGKKWPVSQHALLLKHLDECDVI
ncbi:Oidioi.mRNA.OKI2018_I69.PAR.g11286.t1.cds [Oikopleura dioica]|uniref:Oidioi.mRNA.OKI2018_I69.PAR.g11286.t1.cds n=1 Tax=Oikopleura dioica TaxID=34765 RepID=A0ABN7RVC0_OIKDI|nr:Oidioi.mRNA.OKI2018_I69.PAR.g11286.t1.cds [Oikopleura dioica]